jgi:hypothetical protein
MGLPTTFSGVKTDEQGRRYVIHEPSGVIYFVRDDHPVWGRNAKHGPVTTYSRSAEKRAAKKAKKAQRKLERLTGDTFTSPPVARVMRDERGEYRATFIPVEGVDP